MPGCIALIVAAGRGQRLGGGIPKQYRRLGGEPLLRWTVQRFLAHPDVSAVRAVIHPDDRPLYDEAVSGLAILPPVDGGETRQDSCRLGLESLADQHPDTVLIHDAARPFVDADIIARTLGSLAEHAGAVAAVPVVDTLKREADGRVAATVERGGLWRAQTPQGFRYGEILAAHRAASGQSLTDDAAVAENAGLDVVLIEGSEENFKITTEQDFQRAESMLASGDGGETRTGAGFDVHRFGPGDHVMLCGVELPHDQGLVGHSDADVGLHALTDALLGAIGAGDIGAHFPPSDPQWKGAPSDVFLREAARLVADRGGRITGVDVTLICEAPKIRPHHARLVARVAEILDIAAERVSVKATTTEGLGFTGRGEGIAAQAMATIEIPRA